jgi:transcription initiation factor TFIID subunit 7
LGLRDEELLFYDLKFDGWNFTSKLVDLPTIMESHKTLDNKNFYKTADICQLLICKEG